LRARGTLISIKKWFAERTSHASFLNYIVDLIILTRFASIIHEIKVLRVITLDASRSRVK